MESQPRSVGPAPWASAQAWHVSLIDLEDANPQIPDSLAIHPGELVFHP